MNEKDFIIHIRNLLHNFMGMKVNLILEDNEIPAKDDLEDAMDFISHLCNYIEKYITDNSSCEE